MSARRIVAWLRTAAPWLAAVALALLAVLPALGAEGMVATRAAGDSPFNLQRVHQMAVALADGHFPPRWMPDGAWGLGYPFWNYYAPLAWLWAGGVAALGGGVVGAVKVTQALCFVLAAVGAWRLARDTWNSAAAGLLGSAAYTFAPYHMVNVYARGDALSELAAYAVFPWLLVSVDRMARRPGARRAAVVAVLTAFLLLAHNISALLFAPLLAAYAAWRLGLPAWQGHRARRAEPRDEESGQPPLELGAVRDAIARRAGAAGEPPAWVLTVGATLARLEWRLWPWRHRMAGAWLAMLGAVVLGALLSAFFWLPALAERQLVMLGESTAGYFDFRNHFLGLDGLRTALIYDYDARAGAPVGMSSVQLALGLLGLAAGWRQVRLRGALLFWAAVAVLSGLLMTPLSLPLWEVVPLLDFAQFPWRWLAVQALALAMLSAPLAAAAGSWGSRHAARMAAASALLASALLAVSALGGVRPEVIVPLPPDRADVWAFELFSGNPGTTVRGEYLPAGVAPKPVSSVDLVMGREGDPVAVSGTLASATMLRHAAAEQEWQVEVGGGRPAVLAFPTLHFDGWMAQVDDTVPVLAQAVPGSGWLRAEVPEGVHVVRLWLGRSTWRALAELLSLGGLAILASLWLVRANGGTGRLLAGVVVTLGASVLLARVLPTGLEPGQPRGPVTLDWSVGPWPHANPDGVAFGDTRLIELTTSATDGPIEAGGSLMLAPAWRDPCDGCSLDAALVSQAQVSFDVPDVWTQEQRSLEEGGPVLELPAAMPPGPYWLRLRLLDDEGEPVPARSGRGRELGAVYMGPVRVLPAAGDDPPTEPEGPPFARLSDVRVHEPQLSREGPWLRVEMTWLAERRPTRDLKTSLRIIRGNAVFLQEDKVPFYGFNPPTAWRVGQPLVDRRWLRVPEVLPEGPFDLQLIVYDEASGEELARGLIEDIELE